MNKNSKRLLAAVLAAGMLAGCASAPAEEAPVETEKATDTVAKAEEQTPPKEVVLGTSEEGSETINMVNQTGHSITGWAVAAAGEPDAAASEQIPDGETIEKEASFVWITPVKDGVPDGPWDVTLTLDDGSEVVLHDLDVHLVHTKDLQVCLENTIAYLTYVDEKGETISTLEDERARVAPAADPEVPAEEPAEEAPAVYQEETVSDPVIDPGTTAQEPVYEEPVYQEPVYQEPVYQEPIYQEPVYEPIYQEPVYQEPVYEQPVYDAPALDSGSSEGCLGDAGW